MRTVCVVGLIAALALALVPPIAHAQPPEPKGKLVYQDDFSNPKKSGLEDNLEATDYSRGFHAPGVYHLKDVKDNETRWELFPNQSYGELTIELDVWDNSDDFTGDVSEGVIVRATDDNHFYTVLIDPRKGQYAARKLDGAKNWTDLIVWKASPLVNRESDVNHLRVDAEGDAFTIYLNGESLDTFSDAAYTRGGIGLILSNVDALHNHMHYDNVKVYTTDTQAGAMQPAMLPTTSQSDRMAPLALALCALLVLVLGLWIRQRHS